MNTLPPTGATERQITQAVRELIVPAGATWTAAKGLTTEATRQGKR